MFLAEHPFGIKPSKKITEENIDSLKKILPIELVDFLFHNDSLKICLNSMADYCYNRKSITVYDSIIPESYVQYEYNWDNELKKWMIESKSTWRFNEYGSFLGTIEEEYIPNSQSWKVAGYDSLFYKDNIKYSSKSSIEGSYKLEVSDDGNIETRIWKSIHWNDTKTIEYKKFGKRTKFEEYSRANKPGFDKKWVLKYVKTYNSTENSSHTRTYYPNEVDSTLRYDLHEVSISLNDSTSIYKKYNIDHFKYKILTDSNITISIGSDCRTRKSFSYDKSKKLVHYSIDSSYYDADSSHYYYSKDIHFSQGTGHVSYTRSDSLGRFVYTNWHGWYEDSTAIHKREEFKYYLPHYSYSKSFRDKQTEKGEKRVKDRYDIEFKPNQYSLCKTNLHWNEENECYEVHNIELKKYNKNEKVIETIDIR